MDWLLHLFGFCSDHAAHGNLMDILMYIGLGGAATYLKILWHKLRHKKCHCTKEEMVDESCRMDLDNRVIDGNSIPRAPIVDNLKSNKGIR